MSGNDFSIVESNYSSAQTEHKNGKIWVILTIVELVIIGVLACLLATAGTGSKNASNDDNTGGIEDVAERKTLVIDNPDEFIATWSAGKGIARLNKASCEEIVRVSSEYAGKYGMQALGTNICEASTVKVKTEVAKSEYYPFSEVRFLSIGDNQTCATFELYSSFEGINSYSFSQSACTEAKDVSIIKG